MTARAGFLLVCLSLTPLTACSSGSGGGGSNPGGSSTLTVTAVAPSSGAVSGGDTLTITGEGFAAGMTVSIGGIPCTNVVAVSDTEATCMTPAVGPNHVGPNDVVLELMTQRVAMVPGFAYLAPVFRVLSPAQGSRLPIGTVAIDFEVENFVLGDYGQGHLHFYIDGRAVGPYEFLNGATSEVHLNGVHTHFVHWTSSSSIEIYGLSEGSHNVEFVLASANHTELPHATATVLLDFELDVPAQGVFNAVRVLDGPAQFPVEMRFTRDGRLFFTSRGTGDIRVVDTTTWQIDPVPFYTVQARTSFFEDGILGIELHPDFATNGLLYVSFTHTSGVGRVVRLRDSNGRGTDETLILDNLPSGEMHPVSKLRFGPDGMLYVSAGDGNQGSLVSDLNTPNGKILRIDPSDGSAPADNPWPGSRAYAIGFRNPFGFDFHPDTGDIWMVDNGTTHDDELNLVLAGGNYGWDGSDSSMGVLTNRCCVDPLWTTGNTQIAPTALAFTSNGTAYGGSYAWNAFFTDNNVGQVSRAIPSGTELDELGSMTIAFTGGLSGLIGLTEGPDGFLYASTIDGGIFRLELIP